MDAVVSARDLTLDLAEELARLAPFGLGNPDVTLLVPATEARNPDDGRRRQAPSLPRAPARTRRGERDRVRPGLSARSPAGGRPLRRRVSPQGEPLERDRRAAARRPPDLRHGRRLRGAAGAPRRSVAPGRVGVDAGGAARLRRARLSTESGAASRSSSSPSRSGHSCSTRHCRARRSVSRAPGRDGTSASRIATARRRALRRRHQRRKLLMDGPSSRTCPASSSGGKGRETSLSTLIS